jgi:asparagine synthase (glutamine-hydrolysing)
MCGIAGISAAASAPVDDAALTRLTNALQHRGPDGTGRYRRDGLGLVQTRLAIIDLETGAQPLYGPGATALVANGEIYNYLELRDEYVGAEFRTHSDCELPLFAFARSGAGFTRDLRGMYAIALDDGETLYLSRDGFGIKPLYYAETAQGLAFASEPQALLKSGLVRREVHAEVAQELLNLQFTTGRRTIFAGIERVLPGETLEVRAGRIVGRRREPALPDGTPRDVDEKTALAQLEQVLLDSVAVHQRSDVPYGMFLSGGIDSSTLLALMARLNERPVRAFTAGFPDTEVHDERGAAERVARAVGAEHVAIAVTERDFRAELPDIVAAIDDPAADYAVVPSYLLAREAAKEVKVVLSGEGGDELFGGYGRYRSVLRPRLLGGRPMRRRGLLDGFGVLRNGSPAWRSGVEAAERESRGHGWTRLQMAQAQDCADWLPHDLLLKLDRCLMAHGLEGRTPFLDPVVADFAFRLPDRLKIANGMGKYLLRRWLETALPAAQPFAPKRGFTVPVAAWIRGSAGVLGPLVARQEGVDALCQPDAVARLFAAFGQSGGKRLGAACWQLLFYALWHRIHGQGIAPRRDIVATLEAHA